MYDGKERLEQVSKIILNAKLVRFSKVIRNNTESYRKTKQKIDLGTYYV